MSEEYSILTPVRTDYREPASEPVFFEDLNLNQIIQVIFDTKKEYDLREYYYRFPGEESILLYRQEILKDMGREPIFQMFDKFSKKIQIVEDYLSHWNRTKMMLQKQKWQYDALLAYYEAVEGLYEGLVKESLQSEGLKRLKEELEILRSKEEYLGFREQLLTLKEEFDSMRVLITIHNDKLRIVTGSEEKNYCDRFQTLFPNTYQDHDGSEYIESPFSHENYLSRFEQFGLELYENHSKEIFQKLTTFAEQFASMIESWVMEIAKEVQFYLSFLLFERQYETEGHSFTFPTIVSDASFQIQDGYDLALWIKNSYQHIEVVPNDLDYLKKERFMVVTGPNQGGKTTFARSIGQIVYFTLLGLKAPCSYARMPMLSGIRTHFSVEESMETGRGKLLEELTRLEPMMKCLSKQNFIIINELFTTAASYDAYIMGKRVMQHFIEQGCYGIYVTHIHELAKETEEIVSLSAVVDEGEHHHRTYKIIRKEAEGIGYANGIVEKYQLTYADIKRRLSNEGIATISKE